MKPHANDGNIAIKSHVIRNHGISVDGSKSVEVLEGPSMNLRAF